MIKELIESGTIAEVILVIMLIEAAVVGIILARQGRRNFIPPYFAGLLAGAGLVLALRTSIADEPWFVVGVFLSVALAAHMLELVLRLRGRH